MAEKKKQGWRWLLWWKVDPEEIEAAVAAYAAKNPFKSPRGIAACCFVLSAAITAAFHLANSTTAGDFVDVSIFLGLALFVYLGHRWAMIAGMAWWTLSKVVLVYSSSQAGGSGGLLFSNVIWWCVYMHAFWFAFRVEQARRKPSIAVASIFE